MSALKLVALALVLAPSSLLAYKLSPQDGQADIGAYHVQPGRCAGVERRLGRARYDSFFRTSPFHTAFSPASPPSPPSSASDPDGAGSGVEAMDATSLCAFNPALTEGYGGGFDSLRLYLVYARCIYGTNEMRVLCGTTNGQGVPGSLENLVSATCPAGTKCKNLCATMRDPHLTSPYAAKQVQLAQCMPLSQWQYLTDMYKPKPQPQPQPQGPSAGADAAKGGKADKIDPKVVDKPPEVDPTKDPTKVDKDGTIAGKVLEPQATTGKDEQPPEPKLQPEAPKQPEPAPAPAPPAPAPPAPPAPQDDKPFSTTIHLSGGLVMPELIDPSPGKPSVPPSIFSGPGNDHKDPPTPPPKAEPNPPPPAKLPDQAPGKNQGDGLPPQKAPTDMGFRKRDLHRGPLSAAPRRRHSVRIVRG